MLQPKFSIMCRLRPLATLLYAALLVVMIGARTGVAEPSRPHIVTILIDDWGWNNWGYHAKHQENKREIHTPTLDKLAKRGIVLDRMYSGRICGPSRAALQSGRNTIHVNVVNDALGEYNLNNTVSGYNGMPLNMTGIATKMAQAGYKTAYSGKWGAGAATPYHIPHGRGYHQSLSFLSGANDYWTYKIGPDTLVSGQGLCNPDNLTVWDLWQDEQPAYKYKPASYCAYNNQAKGCIYEDNLFVNEALAYITEYSKTTPKSQHRDNPLFLMLATHSIHTPLTPPTAYYNKFKFIPDDTRRRYSAMVDYVDKQISRVIRKLKKEGLYKDTLILVMSDNGGPIYVSNDPLDELAGGANNYPLRGGKRSNLEGGVRVNSFLAGGFIPHKKRGTVAGGLIGVEDWYGTFCYLAGIDSFDQVAAAAGLPPVDSVNQWPYLSGETNYPPRNFIILGSADPTPGIRSGITVVHGLIDREGYKLLVGYVNEPIWQGPFYPNATSISDWDEATDFLNCGEASPVYPYNNSCLFNVFSDPTEHENLASDPRYQQKRQELAEEMARIQTTTFSPDRGLSQFVQGEYLACSVSIEKFGGFMSPFIYV